MSHQHNHGEDNGATRTIPKYLDDKIDLNANPVSKQAENVANEFIVNKSATVSLPNRLNTDLQALGGTATPNQVEEALRCLGQYLGLDSTR